MSINISADSQLFLVSLDEISFRLLQVFVLMVPIEILVAPLDNVVLISLGFVTTMIILEKGRIHIAKNQLILLLALIAFLLLTVFITWFAQNRLGHVLRLRTSIGFVITMTAFVTTVKSPKRLRTILWSITLGGLALSVLTIIHVLIGLPFGHVVHPPRTLGPISFVVPRTLGVFTPYGMYGSYVSIGIAWVLAVITFPGWLYDDRSLWVRIMGFAGLTVFTAGLYIGQSRSTFVALMLVVSVFVYVAAIRYYSVKKVTMVLAIPIVALLIIIDPVELLVGVNPRTAGYRLTQYQFAVTLMETHPFTGVGFKHVDIVFGSQIHNFWLTVGAETGIFGFVIWVGIFGYIIIQTIRQALFGSEYDAVIGLVALSSVTGCIAEMMLYAGYNQMVGLLIGIMGASIGMPAYRCQTVHKDA